MNSSENKKTSIIIIFLAAALSGAVTGRLLSAGMSYALHELLPSNGMTNAPFSVQSTQGPASDTDPGLGAFVSANPFGISPQKPDTPAPAPEPEPEPKPPAPPSTLDDVTLRGTLPGVGAWFEKDGKTHLVLVGKNFEKWRLLSVNYDHAIFRRGKNKTTKYLTYGPLQAKPKEAPKPAPAPKPAQAPQTGGVVAASEGQEGQVPAEIVNQLVQNPFDELKRIRLRPNDKSGGLEVQWIQNDSILKRLGVQRGDVIKSVNGIPFTNMGDIANSINSLMNSERFDVEVTRGGKPAALRYVVR